MKFSVYNHLFCYNKKYYLYNLLSVALIELDDDLANIIKLNDISKIQTSYIETMKKMHFIVNDDIDETLEYLYFYNSQRFGQFAKGLSIIFIPTYNCNLKCPYCMQGQKKEHEIISDENIDKIILFIRKQIELSKNKGVPITKLFFHLFGGEPLTAKHSIIKFCEETSNVAKQLNCTVEYTMTSNFTLIDQSIIDLIKKYDIITQVSIDGTKEQHDKLRIRHDNTGTYNTIINNLQKFYDLGLKKNIVIRINLDNKNINNAEEILSNVAKYSDDVYFGYLNNYKGINDSFNNCIYHDNFSEIATKILNPLLYKYGFNSNRKFGKKGACSINTTNRYIVDSNLDLYKCELLLHREDSKIGKISNDGDLIIYNTYYKQMAHNPFNFEKCQKCKLLPFCSGGCLGDNYLKKDKQDGNFSVVSCCVTEDDLNKYLIEFVSQNQ